jgi:hypothetical protein
MSCPSPAACHGDFLEILGKRSAHRPAGPSDPQDRCDRSRAAARPFIDDIPRRHVAAAPGDERLPADVAAELADGDDDLLAFLVRSGQPGP